MKIQYRGHEIEVFRDKCMGGWSQLFYSIFRISDGRECTSGFTTDESPVHVYMKYMKERVDAELAEATPWGDDR